MDFIVALVPPGVFVALTYVRSPQLASPPKQHPEIYYVTVTAVLFGVYAVLWMFWLAILSMVVHVVGAL